MKKIANIIINTVLALVIFTVPALFLATHYGLLGPIEVKIVRSGSMEPVIHTGGLVFIQKAASYKVGDIITFGADTRTAVPTTHRIVSIRQQGGLTYYTTKGDANKDPDPGETPATKVIGKVFFALPFAGYVLAFAKTSIGFALLVAIPAALIIMNELIAIVQELRHRRAKKAFKRVVAETEETFPEKQFPPPGGDGPRLGWHFDIGMPFREEKRPWKPRPSWHFDIGMPLERRGEVPP